MKYFIMILLLLTSLPCIAAIYTQTNADGSVTYSDVPFKNAEAVSLSPGNSVSSKPATAKTSANSSATASTTDYYKSFKLISPENNASIQNQPVITVTVATEPEFRSGDVVQVYLDGKPWSEPVSGTRIDMVNVERGEHTLSATLMDSNRQTLKQSDTIKIFVHRVNTNFSPRGGS